MARDLGGTPYKLSLIQSWMLTAATDPVGLPSGLARARAVTGLSIDTVLSAPPGVDPHRRLAIYADGYWMRLRECLKTDYPGLLRLLGETLFDFFARGYLHCHPPSSASLYDLGQALPAFLQRSQKRGARQRFPIELARLERQIIEATRAPGLEGKSGPIADYVSLLGGPCEIGVPATTRLLMLSHPLDAHLSWLDGTGTDDPPETGRDYVAVRRHHFRVMRDRIEDWQFFALRHAARKPRPLIACARAAARRTGQSVEDIYMRLVLWLPGAQAASLVTLT